jgi:hypothetical protein
MRPLLALTAAVLLLGASCGQQGTDRAILTSGAVLKQVGQQWLAANQALVEACRPSAPTLDAATCGQARQVGEKFKTAYPLAMNLYEAGVNANDAKIAGGAKAAIRSLAADAASIAIRVGFTIAEVK